MNIKNNMIIKLRTMKKKLNKIDTQISYLLNDLNKLTVITLPICNSGTNGSIGRNNTGVYGCSSNSVWTKLF